MARRFNRREFVRTSAIGLSAMGLSRIGISQSANADLVVVEGEVVSAAKKALWALGGMKRFVKPGMKVLLKPNISFAQGPEKGVNTDPRLVAAIAQECVDAGASEVLVADFPLYPATLCVWQNGLKEEMDKVKGARVQYFTDSEFFKEVSLPRAKSLKKAKVLKKVLEADLLINIPRAKTHNATTVTLGMKNWMGVVYDRKLWHSEHDLSQAIADFGTLIHPQLTIIDASKPMVDKGPGGPGTLVPLNLVVAGVNQVEADALMVSLCEWYGKKYKPSDVKHLKLAEEHGLGNIDLSSLKYSRLKV